MKKLTKWFSVIALFIMFFSAGAITSFAEDKKDEKLLYDLKYDKKKSILSGKSKPGANIYINDIAGSIVASEDGTFEMPIPKGAKISQILMLDAEGDNSTDLRYNFEKNTVVKQEHESEEDETETSSSRSKKKDDGVDMKSPDDEDKDETEETVTKESDTKKNAEDEAEDSSANKKTDISS